MHNKGGYLVVGFDKSKNVSITLPKCIWEIWS